MLELTIALEESNRMATSKEMAKRCKSTRYKVRKPRKFMPLNKHWGFYKTEEGKYMLCFGDKYFSALTNKYDSLRELRLSFLREHIAFNR